MVRIPNIKIPSVRVGSIGPTSNIGTGGATPAPPAPITYLTQWKIVGNSEVHTDPYLTSWKVEGNSVVDNNAILSCGDLGQDGKYHVKISNGVTIFDIPLTEPLRKVNDVADTIEFPSENEGKAFVTRNIASAILSDLEWLLSGWSKFCLNSSLPIKPIRSAKVVPNILIEGFTTYSYDNLNANKCPYGCTFSFGNKTLCLYDDSFYEGSELTQEFTDYIAGKKIIYELATPTTELIDVSPFPVSSTDTYTSVNVVPYSAFEHTENKEIWSCGEYNPIDGKYHILVQPQGGSIADIALDEPLRMVGDVADTIEFPSGTDGKALVTRNLKSVDAGDWNYSPSKLGDQDKYRMIKIVDDAKKGSKALCASYPNNNDAYTGKSNAVSFGSGNALSFYDADYDQQDSATAFKAHLDGVELIYELATPTTELVDVPQIKEADSYTCEISQGGKAVSWSSFETDRE